MKAPLISTPIDPGDLPSNMQYFPRISQKFRATTHIQSLTNAHTFIKTISFSLRFTGNFTGFNLIYWTPVCGKYFFAGSNLEKCRKFWKNGRFSGRIWPDRGNTAWADMAGLGSKGHIPGAPLYENLYPPLIVTIVTSATSP